MGTIKLNQLNVDKLNEFMANKKKEEEEKQHKIIQNQQNIKIKKKFNCKKHFKQQQKKKKKKVLVVVNDEYKQYKSGVKNLQVFPTKERILNITSLQAKYQSIMSYPDTFAKMKSNEELNNIYKTIKNKINEKQEVGAKAFDKYTGKVIDVEAEKEYIYLREKINQAKEELVKKFEML